jgi:tetratricopeptide (TPR) repeat protein
LKLAADHARATYANGDAIRLYREAIKQVNETLLSLATESGRPRDALIELNEALGDVLALTGQRDEARAVYEVALGLTPEGAESVLGADAVKMTLDNRDEWIQIQTDRLWVHYWLNRVNSMQAIVEDLRSLVDNHGSASQRVRLFHGMLQLNLRRDRYAVGEETLEFGRSAVAVCERNPALPERLMGHFLYGFALLHHGSVDEAESQLQKAMALAHRDGDTAQQARVLTYLTLAARMRRDLGQTQARATRSAEVALTAGTREYLAAARANQAWLALRRSQIDLARSHARHARSVWQSHTGVFPFQWMALLPLLEATLQGGDLAEAVACAKEVLSDGQQCLPEQATDAFVRAGEQWTLGDTNMTRVALGLGLKRLETTQYW